MTALSLLLHHIKHLRKNLNVLTATSSFSYGHETNFLKTTEKLSILIKNDLLKINLYTEEQRISKVMITRNYIIARAYVNQKLTIGKKNT